MAMDVVLLVALRGEVSQPTLDALREQLGLQRQGRLTDQEDELFGYRYLRDDPGNRVKVRLYRAAPDSWAVDLTSEQQNLPAEVRAGWRSEIEAAAARLGLTVDRVWPADEG
jgi:hypothetical protein